MKIGVKIENMQRAERFSYICNGFPFELSLHANQYCADPKSTLGVLAMMYSGKDNLELDTGDMPDSQFKKFTKEIADFVRSEN